MILIRRHTATWGMNNCHTTLSQYLCETIDTRRNLCNAHRIDTMVRIPHITNDDGRSLWDKLLGPAEAMIAIRPIGGWSLVPQFELQRLDAPGDETLYGQDRYGNGENSNLAHDLLKSPKKVGYHRAADHNLFVRAREDDTSFNLATKFTFAPMGYTHSLRDG